MLQTRRCRFSSRRYLRKFCKRLILCSTFALIFYVTLAEYFLPDYAIQACQLPDINYHDKSLAGAFWKMTRVDCKKWDPPSKWNASGFLNIAKDSKFVNKFFGDINNSVACSYTGIEANGDNAIKLSEIDVGQLPGKPKSDFVLVNCSNKNGTFYRDLKYHVIPKTSLPTNRQDEKFGRETDDQLSMIVFGLDSVSRLVAEHKLPITLKFFRETLKSYDFKGYTKIGDNTLPNIVAALTGQSLVEAMMPTFDFPLFFKNLNKLGYVTSYGEDWIPYFPPMGFKYPDYTHNLRQFFLAAADYKPMLKGYQNKKDAKCTGTEFKHDIVINFADEFNRAYEDRLKGSITWISEIIHHECNFLEAGDQKIKDFFENMHKDGKLNRTVVVLFSDHGPRYGKVVEKDLIRFTGRLPLLQIVIPQHIREKYPHIDMNMNTNTNRLTTPFDLHEMLEDILFQRFQDTTAIVKRPFPRGISLFQEVPASRSCYDAFISEHYCPCYTLTDVAATDLNVERGAQFMVETINIWLEPHRSICSEVILDSVQSAKQQNNHERSGVTQKLTIVFKTTSGNGVFEGTVEVTEKEVILLGDINRLTAYKDYANCMTVESLKLYCHCLSSEK